MGCLQSTPETPEINVNGNTLKARWKCPCFTESECCHDDNTSCQLHCCICIQAKKQNSPRPTISNPIPTSSIQNGTSVIYNLKNNPLAR